MVYPRVCGGAVVESLGESRQDGLSPRVQGAALIVEPDIVVRGLSPRVRGSQTGGQ